MKNQYLVHRSFFIPYSSILYVRLQSYMDETHKLNIVLLDSTDMTLDESFPTEAAALLAAAALADRIHAARTGRNVNDLRH